MEELYVDVDIVTLKADEPEFLKKALVVM